MPSRATTPSNATVRARATGRRSCAARGTPPTMRAAAVADRDLERRRARRGHDPHRAHLAARPAPALRGSMVSIAAELTGVAERGELLAVDLLDRLGEALDHLLECHVAMIRGPGSADPGVGDGRSPNLSRRWTTALPPARARRRAPSRVSVAAALALLAALGLAACSGGDDDSTAEADDDDCRAPTNVDVAARRGRGRQRRPAGDRRPANSRSEILDVLDHLREGRDGAAAALG